jgi:hypothetical protein
VDRWIRDNPLKEPSFPHTTSRTDLRPPLYGLDLRWTGGSQTTPLKSRLFPTLPLAQTFTPPTWTRSAVDRRIRDNPLKEPSFPHTTSRTDLRPPTWAGSAVDRWIRDNPLKEPSFPHTTSRTDLRPPTWTGSAVDRRIRDNPLKEPSFPHTTSRTDRSPCFIATSTTIVSRHF